MKAMEENDHGVVIGYMCAVDWEWELGAASGGNTIYPSEKDAVRCRKCISGCGLVEVEVRFRRVILEGKDRH